MDEDTNQIKFLCNKGNGVQNTWPVQPSEHSGVTAAHLLALKKQMEGVRLPWVQ